MNTTSDKYATIKSAQIVYVIGPGGTGKTFTGDYMAVMHDYHHVDGDIPLKHMCLVPEYKEISEKWIIEGDWDPFYSELARLALEGAKDNDKVVLSHATDKNDHRDHVIKKLIEGGASEDKITIIQLTIDPKVKARGLYHRTVRMAEQSGMTMTECCKASLEFEGEMTEEKYIDIILGLEAEQPEDAFEVHPKAIMVDISGRDVTHFDNVDKALGLTRSDELTYESISDKVIHIDEARDKIMFESGYMLAITDILARAEDAQKSPLAIEQGDDEKK
uniref:Zeta toxin domain-containing protein n=1 Tax=Skeletonema marinoi TaxID=267567 RepID=A0A7S2P1U9_9STRA